jgi:hypothetical protein
MAQANYKQAVQAMRERKPFKGNTLSGECVGDAYEIYSYSTLMARVESNNKGQDVVTYINRRKYSVTTSKHQTYIMTALGEMLFRESAVAALEGTF